MNNCRLLNESGLGLALLAESVKREQRLCDACGYDVSECPNSNHINVSYSNYKIIELEKPLPKQGAWCRDCASNSAKPIHYVNFNGRKGIVVECKKCHEKYVLYERTYIERYVGKHTVYGFVPPTYGHGNWRNNMPKNVKNAFDKAREKREKDTSEYLASLFGYTNEEYALKKQQWAKDEAISHKKILQKEEERRAESKEDELLKKSQERKKLIEEGVIRYDKKARCLIDTRTNQVITI